MTGAKIGDGYWGPKWLGWKRDNQPTVDPEQVLRYLQAQGIDRQEAVNWTNKIGERSGFVGNKEGGLFGWEGSDFSSMKSSVGKNWADDWQGQLNYLIKDQVILREDHKDLAGTNKNNSGVTSSNNTATSSDNANNLNELSSSTTSAQMNPNVIVNVPMPGEGGGAVGTTPSGYLNGISMADTGTEIFANLKIRSLR